MATENPLLQGVATLYAEKAEKMFRIVELGPGGNLIREGDTDTSVMVILEGEVEIKRGEVVVDHSGPGEVIGEVGLFLGSPRMATLNATKPSKFAVLDRAAYDELVRQENPTAYNLERMALEDLSVRLARLDGLIAEHAEGEPSPFAASPGLFGMIRKMLKGRKDDFPEPTELDQVEVLTESGLFEGASYDHLHAIAAQLRQETYKEGHFLCTQGEPGDKMYFLGAGLVDVVVCMGDPGKKGSRIHPLGSVKQGGAFAITAVIGDRPRGVSCVASTTVDVLAMDRATFDRFTNTGWPEASTFRRGIIKAVGHQLSEASASLMQLVGQRDVDLVGTREAEMTAAAGVEFTGRLAAFDPQ